MNNHTLSGIEVLGEIPWGTHFCQFYETKRDLLEILVPYFKTGLENKEFCLWVVSNPKLTIEEAKAALEKTIPNLNQQVADGNIEIKNATDWYMEGGVVNLERAINAWDEKYKHALAKGYTGMRASGDTLWLSENNWKDFNIYENQIDDFVAGERMTVLCTYPLEKYGAAEILDVVNAHQYTLARRKGKWEMIVTAVQMQALAEIKRLNEVLQQIKERIRKPHPVLDYGVAALSVIGAILIVSLIKTSVPFNAPYVSLFLCAVIFSTWFGGTGPGLLSTFLSTLALAYYFLFPIHPFPLNSVQFLRLLLFLVPSLFIVWLSASQRKVAESLTRGRNILEEAVEKLKQTNITLHDEITERKQAEDVFRKSEDRLRLVIDTVPALIHTGLPDGQLDFFNQRWLDFVGLSLEDVSGWKWTAAIHPEDVGAMVERWRVAGATGEPYEHEARVRRADGEYRRMVHYEVPLRDERGKIVKWYASSMDIEDRKRAEDGLRQSEQRFAAFMDNLPGYAWMKDLQGRYVYVNEMVRGLPGYWSLGKTDAQIWPADLVVEYRANDKQVIAAKQPLHTLEHFQLEGKTRHMAGSKFPIFDKTGAVALVGGVGVDITERIEAEEAVRRSEEHLRLVIDTIPTMAWSVRPDGVVDFLNQRWMEYSGLSLEEYIKDPTGPIHPDDTARVMEKWAAMMAAEESNEDEMRLRGVDGNYRWFLVRTAPLYDQKGNLIKWYGVSIDIEDRKRLSDALQVSEQRYISLFENMAEGVAYFRMFFTDNKLQDAIYLEVNQAWVNLTGLTNVIDRKITEVFPGVLASQSEFFQRAARVALTGQAEQFETYSKLLKKWLSVSAYSPQLAHVIVVMDDITERKQAQDNLQLAYQRLSYHVENTPLAVIEFDKDLFVTRWSKRAEEIFGWKTAEALGKNVYDADFRIIYKEDILAVDTINDELTTGAVNWNQSMNRNYTKGGDVIYCEWYNSVLKDEHGKVITILSLVLDVTERKNADEKLKNANAELHSLSSRLQNLREVERTAIAREIHDELGQQLTGLKIDALWVAKRITREEKAIKEKISDMVAHINDAVKTIRRISTELRPSMLDDLGLIAALEWQAKEFATRTGIQSQFTSNRDDLNLDVTLSTNIFRVYQEALTNVVRHANATQVETVFEEADNYINLMIKDNGQGFDLNEIKTNQSFGLIGMKERAMMLHGELTIESNRSNGTVVSLKVPLREGNLKISQ